MLTNKCYARQNVNKWVGQIDYELAFLTHCNQGEISNAAIYKFIYPSIKLLTMHLYVQPS